MTADAWSVTSYTELREDALSVERWNRLHPGRGGRGRRSSPRRWRDGAGPVVAVTDFCGPCRTRWRGGCRGRFTSLGTDGFGRSDTRAALRRFFEVDAAHVVVAVLSRTGGRRGGQDATRWPRPSTATASTPTPPIPGPSEVAPYPGAVSRWYEPGSGAPVVIASLFQALISMTA